MSRLQAYGFIDSFINSLIPTIKSLQNKIKRWINAEVTSSLGPAGRAVVLVRAPGGRVRAQAPFTARPPGCCAHVRAPARRARACTSVRSLPAGPTYSRNVRPAGSTRWDGCTRRAAGRARGELQGSRQHCRAVCPPTHCRPKCMARVCTSVADLHTPSPQ